jgi:photosystem II stability/assembly factor-like uncharacterized protein
MPTIDAVTPILPNSYAFDALSCPSLRTCFAVFVTLAPNATTPISPGPTVLMETRDGGRQWTKVGSFENLDPIPANPGPLTCPTITSCYVLSQTNLHRAATVMTHDGGAAWRRSSFGSNVVPRWIACATAAACRVATSAGIIATADGGKTWHRQKTPADISGIACPGVDTCYAVGGMDILATHRP